MLWLYVVLLSAPCMADNFLSESETSVLFGLVEYLKPPVLYVLDEDLAIFNISNFPGKNFIPTAAFSAAQLNAFVSSGGISSLGGMPLVALQENSKAWLNFLKIANDRLLRAAKWVTFSKDPITLSKFSQLYIPFDCEFISVNPQGNLMILKEIYNIKKGGPVEITHFGSWSPTIGFNNPALLFYERRSDFKGYTFSSVIENKPPYTYIVRDENGQIIYGGYLYEVWKELENRLNFKTEFRSEFPYTSQTGIGNLQELDFDFGVLPVPQVPTYADYLSEPVFEAKVYLFGNRPGSELEWNSYLKPFSQNTWLVTLGWMFASAIALTVIYSIAKKYKTSESDTEQYLFTFSVSLTTVFRALCSQGSDITPNSNSCRLIFLSVYMAGLILTSAFSAALFSLLTVPVSRAPFYSFDDVINTRGYKIGIIPNSDAYVDLKELATRFPDSEHNKLLNMLEPKESLPLNVPEALGRVCTDKNYVFIWDLPNVIYYMQNLTLDCQEKIMPGGPVLFKQLVGFGMQKESPYRSLIDQHLMQMRQEGILKRLLLNNFPPKIPDVVNSWMKVTLRDIGPILIMFGIGGGISVLFVVLENIHKRLIKKLPLKKPRMLLRDFRFGFTTNITPIRAPSPVPSEDSLWKANYSEWGDYSTLHRRQRENARSY